MMVAWCNLQNEVKMIPYTSSKSSMDATSCIIKCINSEPIFCKSLSFAAFLSSNVKLLVWKVAITRVHISAEMLNVSSCQKFNAALA